jgi:hypothetical protein
MEITFVVILRALGGVDVGVDQAGENHAVLQIHDMSFRPYEGFDVRILAHEDNGIAADRERLSYVVVWIFSVNPTVNQDEIGEREIRN